jgi:hypothetical protein
MRTILLWRMGLGLWLVSSLLSACGSNQNGSDSSSDNHGEPGGSGGASDGTGGAGERGALVVINELMASNSKTVAENGTYPDWIELYNPTDRDVDLGGYYVSDKLDDPRRVELPEGLTIDAKGYLLLWADGDLEEGNSHLPFKLSKDGEAAVISGPDGTFLDSVEFQDAPQDYSYARFPNGVGDFAWCWEATPRAENPDQCPPSADGSASAGASDAGSD